MKFNQAKYIAKFNKNNYKMYQFRVKKTETTIINYLDNVENRNKYIMDLIDRDVNRRDYTIKESKTLNITITHMYTR